MSGLEVELVIERAAFEVKASFRVGPGRSLALFGPSGAGKTTLLETIAGLVTPTTGACRLDGEQLSRPAGRSRRPRAEPFPPATERVSIVRQPTSLFPHLDVAGNLAYGRSDPALSRQMVAAFELEELLGAHPAQLSGGQAQRVALARALSRHFDVLLLDEPMAAMDAGATAASWEVIGKRCADEGAVSLLVTHDLVEAQAFGDELAIVDKGEILQAGDPHEVCSRPASRRAAEVLGYSAFLRLRPPEAKEHLPTGSDLLELAIDPSRVRLGAHPEAGAVCRGVVTACTPHRAGFRLQLTLSDGEPVTLPLRGVWTAVGPAKIVIEVDGRVTLGKELLATAIDPPVVGGT